MVRRVERVGIAVVAVDRDHAHALRDVAQDLRALLGGVRDRGDEHIRECVIGVVLIVLLAQDGVKAVDGVVAELVHQLVGGQEECLGLDADQLAAFEESIANRLPQGTRVQGAVRHQEDARRQETRAAALDGRAGVHGRLEEMSCGREE